MSGHLPRGVSGADLIRMLARHGYMRVRQSGSHVRLTRRTADGEWHLTVPMHDPFKVGTLGGLLTRAAADLGIDRDELVADL